MSKPFPCCQCDCSECVTLFGYNFYGALCNVNAVTMPGLTAPQQADNDAFAAWLETNYANVNYQLGTVATGGVMWGGSDYFVRAISSEISSLSLPIHLEIPAFAITASGIVRNTVLTLGAMWETTGRACDPEWFWWLACDFAETSGAPTSNGRAFVTYSGSNATGRQSLAPVATHPYYLPPNAVTTVGTVDCAPPTGFFVAGGGVHEKVLFQRDPFGTFDGTNPIASGAKFLINPTASVSSAPPCPP